MCQLSQKHCIVILTLSWAMCCDLYHLVFYSDPHHYLELVLASNTPLFEFG